MVTQLSGPTTVVSQALFTQSSTANQGLGETVFSNDGRAFRYVQAGAADLVSGQLIQSAAEVTANQNLTAVAASVGDSSIAASTTVTVTANQYAGGLAVITTSAGAGIAYRISGHAAFTAAAPTIQLADTVKVALTTGSRIDLVANPYQSVIQNPVTPTSSPVGVACGTLTTLYYGWVQVSGTASVLADGALVVGSNVVASNGTAGAVETAVNNIGTQTVIGIAQTGVATTEFGAVRLTALL